MTAQPVILILAATLASVAAAADVTVTTIDGETHTGELVSLDADGAVVRAGRKSVTVADDDLHAIRWRDVSRPPRQTPSILRTVGGGVIPVRAVMAAEGRLTADSTLGGAVSMDMSQVASVLFAQPKREMAAVAEAIEALKATVATGDVLLARSDEGELVPASGVLVAIGPAKVTFNCGGDDRTIDAAKVVYIRLGSTGRPPSAARGTLTGVDGTRIGFVAASVADGHLKLKSSSLGDVSLPLSQVADVRYHSDRVTYLSDLTPTAVRQAGTFGEAIFEYQRDQSTLRTPIRLDGRTYSRGVGIHSLCELTYALAGRYATFVALAGIDDAARPRGHAVLTITANGKPLAGAIALIGADRPHPLRLDTRGLKVLTILVDFGPDLDIGDHVDLAEARLITPKGVAR